MFICAAVLVGLLSQETENRQKDLIASKDEIEKKHAALIGYMTEYTLRLKQPIELVLENLRSIHGALSEKPDAGIQDIRDSLMIQIKNTEQIHANLQTINNAVAEERDDIPEVFREFLKR
jgi:methyl-accepting chemotaxis protein